MTTDPFLAEFMIPEDTTENAVHPELYCSVDDDGDLFLSDGIGQIMMSYAQAHALIATASQKLIAYDRTFGYRPRNSLKEVAND